MSLFTQDLKGHEVEIKLQGTCINPTTFVLDVMDDFDRGRYAGWSVQREMGVRETAVTSWRLNIEAWGVREPGFILQKIMVAERADGAKTINQKETRFPLITRDLVLVRSENKSKAKWMMPEAFSEAWLEMQAQYPGLVHFGSYLRTKTMFFVASRSRRNYCFAADYNISGDKQLFQVEIEYKGRQGKHEPSGKEPLVGEMSALAQSMEDVLDLRITSLTKLEWLLTGELKILHVTTPWYPVPTRGYGGVEKFISDLLIQQSKDYSVSLFAAGDSTISSGISLKYIFDKHIADSGWDRSAELIQALAAADEIKGGAYDIIHVHNLHSFLPLLHLFPESKIVFTHHSVLTQERKIIHELTSEQNKNVQFVFLSRAHRAEYQHIEKAEIVHYGIDLKDFPMPKRANKKDYFAFVGAICDQKGIVDAIEATQVAGAKLKVAGVVKAADKKFFDNEVAPRLRISKHVEFVGMLNNEQRNFFLAESKALIFPIKWAEPFGRVVIEALAMDTPVIGYANGSLPEIINDTCGVLVYSFDELVANISCFKEFKDGSCRTHVERNFSIKKAKIAYDKIYNKLLSQA